MNPEEYAVLVGVDPQLTLGIKSLIESLCAQNGQETDQQDLDSFYCHEALKGIIQYLPWYQFYDAVEIIGQQLKESDAKRPFSWGAEGL